MATNSIAFPKMFDVSTDKQITDILDRVPYLGKINYKGELIA